MSTQPSLFDYMELYDLFSTKESVEKFSGVNEKEFDELGIYKPVAFYWVPHLKTEIYVYSTNKNYARENKEWFRSNILSSSLGFKYKRHMYRKLNKKRYRDAMKGKNLIDVGSLYLHNLKTAIAAHHNYTSNPYELVPHVFDDFVYGFLLVNQEGGCKLKHKDRLFNTKDMIFIREGHTTIDKYRDIGKTIIYYPQKGRNRRTKIVVKLDPILLTEPRKLIYFPDENVYITIDNVSYRKLKEIFKEYVERFIKERKDIYETIYRIEDGY